MDNSLGRRVPSTIPAWSWAAFALLLLALFFLLLASGALLAPLLGEGSSGVFNYLHGFAHDGRHILAVPCH